MVSDWTIFSCANSDFSAQLLLLCGDIESNPGPITDEGEQRILQAINGVMSEIKHVKSEITSIKSEIQILIKM